MTSPRNLFTPKASKLLAGTLTAALILSTGGLSAFAASSPSATSVSSPAPLLPAPEAGLPPAGTEPLSPPAGAPGGPGLGGPGLGGLETSDLLATLGLSASGLRTALESGSSLSAIAKQQNVDSQKLLKLTANAIEARLSQEYKDGRITESVYKSRLSEVSKRAASLLNQTRPKPPVHGSAPADTAELPPLGPGLESLDRSELAGLLGISTSQLASGLGSGQSLAELAGTSGTSTQKLMDLVAAALTQDLKERLARGDLWTDEYSAELANVQTRAADLVQHVHPLPPHLLQNDK
ncbi:hypothetical protein [Paenibacillus sp. FSL R7-0333]|uniref:hypothetical protein n=1 Tax=Paenibacillus sp. FSL R7-0333 TaxID=1926587 RepID=UPI00096E68C3|nr:hypothetical protein BK146_08190 [Paenibacillus sp. FSL R7-0333]